MTNQESLTLGEFVRLPVVQVYLRNPRDKGSAERLLAELKKISADTLREYESVGENQADIEPLVEVIRIELRDRGGSKRPALLK